ncbi:MAG: alpha/beta hydrolase [bacterium]|nr:alpha/beta hydrolase [bacterium]
MKTQSFLFILCLAVTAVAQDPCEDVLSYSELITLEQPQPAVRLSYGDDPFQFGELRLPAGEGPFPVVVVVHGGCWLSDFDTSHIRPFAAALSEAGYATWTPEYRRVGNDGGGWPNTFLDLAKAADLLLRIADNHRLDLDRVVALGHSAGGHLALWLAARHRLPSTHPLHFVEQPIGITGVVSLAGIPDLRQATELEVCGDAAPRLLGISSPELEARFDLGSPATYLPLGVPQFVLNGNCDPIVPVTVAEGYADTAASSGDSVNLVVVPRVGHFELVSPESTAWPAVLAAVEALVEPRS